MRPFALTLLLLALAPAPRAQPFNTAENQVALAQAVVSGDAATVERLLDAGVDVTVPFVSFGVPATLLDLALGVRNATTNESPQPPRVDIVQMLLEAGADPEARVPPHVPRALERAAVCVPDSGCAADAPGYTEAARVLLRAGADPDAVMLLRSVRQYVAFAATDDDETGADRARYREILDLMAVSDREGWVEAGAARRHDARMRAFARQVAAIYALAPSGFEAIRGDFVGRSLFEATAVASHPGGDGADALTGTPSIDTGGKPLYSITLADGAQDALFALAQRTAQAIAEQVPGLRTESDAPYAVTLYECPRDADGYQRRGRTIGLGTTQRSVEGIPQLTLDVGGLINGEGCTSGATGAVPGSPGPAGADLTSERMAALFGELQAAMNQPAKYRRATLDGDVLVLTSSTCTVRIPLSDGVRVAVHRIGNLGFHADGIEAWCSGPRSPMTVSYFDFQTPALRTRAENAARAFFDAWAAGGRL